MLRPLPIRLDVPGAYRAKARYALEELLRGMGLVPVEGGDPLLVYGPDPLPGALHVPLAPDAAAFFAGRGAYDPARAAWRGGVPVLFGTADAPDAVASAFFWLSGWQEVTSAARDEHGRFPFADSLQARWGLAIVPVVDAVRDALADALRRHGVDVPGRTWGGRSWAFCPTCDVDYVRKWRPGILKRELLERALLNREREPAAARLGRVGAAVRGLVTTGDPYRSALDRMPREIAAREGTGTFFFKAAARDAHDVPYRLGPLRPYAGRLRAKGFEVGLHPSYAAFDRPDWLVAERDRITQAFGTAPSSVRGHYLRYAPGATHRLHEAAGFRLDSTLGWAEHEGFRHATTHPFRPYDLDADRPSAVWEFPLALMDGAVFRRRALGPDGARAATRAVFDAARRHGGVAVGLWHNVLWDEVDAPGWAAHFTDALDAANSGGARVASLQHALDAWLA